MLADSSGADRNPHSRIPTAAASTVGWAGSALGKTEVARIDQALSSANPAFVRETQSHPVGNAILEYGSQYTRLTRIDDIARILSINSYLLQ
jgi:hypothetical protein